MKTPPPPLHELILARGFADFPAGVTKEQVLATLGRAACEEALVPPGRVAEVLSSLRANEQMMSSGMGGVAIPHVRHPAVARDAVRVGRVRDGLAFDSLDGRPVHLVFLILLPRARTAASWRSCRRSSRP